MSCEREDSGQRSDSIEVKSNQFQIKPLANGGPIFVYKVMILNNQVNGNKA